MIPYIIALLLPMGLLLYVDNYVPKRRIAVILTIFALLIPCVIAGGRDSGIGLDTLGYGDQVFNIAVKYTWDWNGFLDEVNSSGFDIGIAFSSVAFCAVSLTGSRFIYYLIIECLILFPLYHAFRILAPGKCRALSYLIIFLVFYMLGLSAMRQFIALSFGFLSVATLISGKNSFKSLIISLIWAVISILFHNSAAFILICHIGWILLVRYDDGVPKLRKYALICLPAIGVMVVLISFFIDPIFRIVTRVIPIFERYASYLATSGTSDGFTFFIFFGVMIASAAYRGREFFKTKDPVFIFVMSFGILSLVIYSLQSYNEEFIRLSYYFWPFVAVSLPISVSENKSKESERGTSRDAIAEMMFLVFCAGQFTWWYVINDYWNCLPYSSLFFECIFRY